MNEKLIIRSEAEAEIEQAFRWYEERRPGLGADFLLCVEESLALIERNLKTFQKIHLISIFILPKICQKLRKIV